MSADQQLVLENKARVHVGNCGLLAVASRCYIPRRSRSSKEGSNNLSPYAIGEPSVYQLLIARSHPSCPLVIIPQADQPCLWVRGKISTRAVYGYIASMIS